MWMKIKRKNKKKERNLWIQELVNVIRGLILIKHRKYFNKNYRFSFVHVSESKVSGMEMRKTSASAYCVLIEFDRTPMIEPPDEPQSNCLSKLNKKRTFINIWQSTPMCFPFFLSFCCFLLSHFGKKHFEYFVDNIHSEIVEILSVWKIILRDLDQISLTYAHSLPKLMCMHTWNSRFSHRNQYFVFFLKYPKSKWE